ncbi:hypothetical protein CYLTODRAFT_398793 [Cylindrobasidium torrendii FP15055 ss-10]|uniref:Uncharacterized protein n=1 Tax=Cylindrobasidium torrendii FP15055 ss-10 TaxID=1314674 RepID=A0A0D7B847_9AGAR|nr:hypothetical protein CYLTODRAFT_398793 [Cylindrobasidium torrendii FP15055 ss-10]
MNLDEFDPIDEPQPPPRSNVSSQYSQDYSPLDRLRLSMASSPPRPATVIQESPQKSTAHRMSVTPARGPLIFAAAVSTDEPPNHPLPEVHIAGRHPVRSPPPPSSYVPRQEEPPRSSSRNSNRESTKSAQQTSGMSHPSPSTRTAQLASQTQNKPQPALPNLNQRQPVMEIPPPQRQQLMTPPPPQTPPKQRHLPEPASQQQDMSLQRTVTPTRSTDPPKRSGKHRPTTPVSLDQDRRRTKTSVDMPYFSDDPFAKSDGVKIIPAATPKPAPQPTFTEFDDDEVVLAPAVEVQRPATPPKRSPPHAPPTPPSPEEYKRSRRNHVREHSPPREIARLPLSNDRPPEAFPLDLALEKAGIVAGLLPYLTYGEWLQLSNLSQRVRRACKETDDLRKVLLQRFLGPVGYQPWIWGQDPLPLTLADLNHYMRGVTLSVFEYSTTAQRFMQMRDQTQAPVIQQLRDATRAYTRIVLRLRAQAEKEARTTRAPSPTFSQTTHGTHGTQHGSTTPSHGFRSPLYRLRRAPLLRVFVPSPDGDWLSDTSVLECEAELKRAGVLHLMRVGDVVWDVAVGEEGNFGRMIWDGSYLIDLDYTYSAVGDLPKYLPTLAFSPSYFHRVIRTGPAATNPIVRLDLAPWGDEIAGNLQLLQDRVRTETPQGTYHNVVRWVHRSSFTLKPPGRGTRIPVTNGNGGTMWVDSGWYGTVVVETEGTNESLADLQERCGPGAFPPRVQQVGRASMSAQKDKDAKTVFRILREKSRPGEIWIRTVSPKERIN